MRSLTLLRVLGPVVVLSFATPVLAQDTKPEPKPAEKKPEAKPADKKPAEKKPADTKPAEATPAEAKPAEATPEPGQSWTPSTKDTEPPPIAPPAPPPWTSGQPTSTSGTQLMPPTQPAQAGAGTMTPEQEIALDNRIKMIEERLAAEEKDSQANREKLSWLRKLRLSGFIQPQLLWQSFNSEASPNVSSTTGQLPPGIGANSIIAKSDGTTTNGNFFRLRRARLKFEYFPTDYARLAIEIDPMPTGGSGGPGTGTIARNVEAVGIIKWDKDLTSEIGMGIFKVPISGLLMQSDVDRPFAERSWYEQNLFPGDFDTGARATLHALDKKLNAVIAVINGVTIGQQHYTLLPDFNKGKDLVVRASYDAGPVDFGISGDYGQGQTIDSANLRFKQYPRWAANFEVGVHHTFIKDLGRTKLNSELIFAQNMDRGTKYAFALPTIPVNINDDVVNIDQRGFQLRLEQELTEWALFAFRYDHYTPNSDIANNGRHTYGLVGGVNPTKGLRLLVELDHAIDEVHRPGAAPANKQIETFSTMLQARF
jgi:hypothetical protein